MIKAILIDIDNTLLDFDAYVRQSMKEGFEKFGLCRYEEYMDEVFWRINSKMWRDIEDGKITYEELLKTRWDKIFEELSISFDGCIFEKYFKGCLFYSAIPIDGAFEMLEYLNGKYPLYVASNGPYDQQVNRLKKGNMLSYFSDLFISEKVGASKPSKAFFSHCLTEINKKRAIKGEDTVLPNELLMIGDSISSDIIGAIDSGIKCCYYNKKNKCEPEGLSIDKVIYRLEDVCTFL